CLSASSEPLDKLAIIADQVLRLLVHPRLSVRPKLFLHHPSHLHAMLSQPWTLARADPRAVSTSCPELTRERNSLATNDIVLTAGDPHSRSRSVNREKWHLLLSSPL
ncbi:hypothetical protein TNCV_423421, partial [Trichonephila clavipes]